MKSNYQICPRCGTWHDDGGFVLDSEGKYHFLCLDCAELAWFLQEASQEAKDLREEPE